jgi:hypothetical protein
MARRDDTSYHATLYDFRDFDIMAHIDEHANGGVSTHELAEMLGFPAEEAGRAVGGRLGKMRTYGMVKRNNDTLNWSLTAGGARVVQARIIAPQFRAIESMPDEAMIETMALVTSRFQRGDTMLAQMLRREFLYGTQRR